MSGLPSEETVLEYYDALSNWGRWGVGESTGALNLITPDVRRAAAALVTEGRVVSCAHDVLFEGDKVRFMTGHGEGQSPERRERAGPRGPALERMRIRRARPAVARRGTRTTDSRACGSWAGYRHRPSQAA